MISDEERRGINWFLTKDGKIYASKKGFWLTMLITILGFMGYVYLFYSMGY